MTDTATIEEITLKARKGLEMVSSGEYDAIQGWIEYGHALIEGRRTRPSNELYGKWIRDEGLDQLEVRLRNGKTKIRFIDNKTRAASIWAAGYPDQFNEAYALVPDTESIRSIHDRWQAMQPRVVRVDFDSNEPRLATFTPPRPEPKPIDGRVLEKFKKAEALATNNPNQHEAAAAKAKAEKILAEAGTSREEVIDFQEQKQARQDKDQWNIKMLHLTTLIEKLETYETEIEFWSSTEDFSIRYAELKVLIDRYHARMK